MKLARAACAAALTTALFASPSARAQGLDPTRSEAAERFDRALRLVNGGDLSGGLAEFQRAYALVPSSVLVYNIGLVQAALHRPVQAVKALQQALDHADTLNPDEVVRARSVQQQQSEIIGQVAVTTNVKEGVVEIDNVEVAKLPLSGPLDVSAGPHIVGVVSTGFAPSRHEVTVAGHQKVDVDLELVPIQGLLGHIAVKSRIPGADVLVDGQGIGKTPLESTISVTPGAHKVQLKRAGYLPAEREVTLTDGAQTDIDLEPVFDKASLATEGGTLSIEASEAQPILTVDGTELGLVTGPVQLPAGPHRIRLESGGFIPAERDVDVPLALTKNITVVFEPTPETRSAYVAGAKSRRTWSGVTISLGAVIAGAGTALALIENKQIPGAQNNVNATAALYVRHSGLECDPAMNAASLPAACNTLYTDANNTLSNDQNLRTVGIVGASVGAAVLVTGVILLVTGDDPHKYDTKPSERTLGELTVTPWIAPGSGSLSVGGVF
jgi:hypothetical protein